MGLSRNAGWQVKICSHDLADAWWCEMICFQFEMICFQLVFKPSFIFFFFSYSIKLLAVQELLDREALEKVNLLFLPPHHHKHRTEGHTREKLSSLWSEIALTAKCICYFVLTSQWIVRHFHPLSHIAHILLQSQHCSATSGSCWTQRQPFFSF